MKRLRLAQCVLIAGALITLSARESTTAPAVGARSIGLHSALNPVPPAASALARRLGISSHPLVGDQAAGMGGPWTVWFPRTIRPRWIGPGNVANRYLPFIGPALFVGPRGAKGEFHYYNPGPIRTSHGTDSYQGAPLTRVRGIQLAYAWLRAIGTPIPRGSPYVQVRRGMTVIGGTGLCCYRSLVVLSWRWTERDSFGNVWSAADMIYVADAGTIVEADIGPLESPSGYGFSHPCPGRAHPDTNGIALGAWCFDYARAVRTMIIGDIGGHSPWVDDPNEIAHIGASYVLQGNADPRHVGHRRQVLLTSQRAVYVQSYKGVPYRMTFVPAFPGLAGSIWELARVQRAG